MTKVFISAGEASGDLHAAALTRAILQQDPTAQVFGMGGDALAAAGGQVVFNYKDYSVMGFVEVLQALPRLLGLKKAFRRLMEERKPDVFVTVDYPDFNMRVAKEAKKLGIPVIGICDTNANPNEVDFPVPGNDDAIRAIQFYCELVSSAVLDGMQAEIAAQGVKVEEAVENIEAKPAKKRTAKKAKEEVEAVAE